MGVPLITTTILFGVYAVAVLAALLALGRLSDSVGRKPVLLAALGVQVASMLVFATAGGVGELMAARVVQGLATGAALGAIGGACSTSTGNAARSPTPCPQGSAPAAARSSRRCSSSSCPRPRT